jgi:hypothetical protein
MQLLNKPTLLIEGRVASLMNFYIKSVKDQIQGEDFKKIDDEKILFALLEYAHYDRVALNSSETRIEYIVRKCVDFTEYKYTLTVDEDGYYYFEFVEDEFPFNT